MSRRLTILISTKSPMIVPQHHKMLITSHIIRNILPRSKHHRIEVRASIMQTEIPAHFTNTGHAGNHGEASGSGSKTPKTIHATITGTSSREERLDKGQLFAVAMHHARGWLTYMKVSKSRTRPTSALAKWVHGLHKSCLTSKLIRTLNNRFSRFSGQNQKESATIKVPRRHFKLELLNLRLGNPSMMRMLIIQFAASW